MPASSPPRSSRSSARCTSRPNAMPRTPRSGSRPVEAWSTVSRSPTVPRTSRAGARSSGRCNRASSPPHSGSSSRRRSSPACLHGWSLTDADTIFAARRAGAVAQLARVCGPGDSLGPLVDDVASALARAVEPLRPEGRPLFAGLRDRWDDPTESWTRLFHLGDMLREYRGDAHVASWTSEGLDAVQIGLLTEAYIGLPLRTYIRTRAWNDDELDTSVNDLEARGWLRDGTLTDAGRTVREGIERRTDAQLAPALDALRPDLDDVVASLQRMGRGDACRRRVHRWTRRSLARAGLSRTAVHASTGTTLRRPTRGKCDAHVCGTATLHAGDDAGRGDRRHADLRRVRSSSASARAPDGSGRDHGAIGSRRCRVSRSDRWWPSRTPRTIGSRSPCRSTSARASS